MALIPGYINTSPSYDAAGLRMLDSLDLTPDGASTALTSRAGVRPSSVEGLKVTNTAFSYAVSPGYAVVSKASEGALGEYRVASSTQIAGTIPAADATYARRDLVWLRVRDTDVDGSGQRVVDVYYQTGTPSATPVDPTPAPAGALLLARISVPANGGGSPTVTDLRVYTVASGGIVPAATAPANPYKGQAYYDTATGALKVYTGTAWVAVADTGAWASYTAALTASTTNPTLGSGGSIVAAYRRTGNTVNWRVTIDSGTSPGAGNGNYRVSLPFPSAAGGGLGSCFIGGPTQVTGLAMADGSGGANMYMPSLVTSASNNVTTGRTYYLFGTYEAA